MFKLFGKKPSPSPSDSLQEEDSPLPSRHPEAAALSAQFGPEEFDILAVTGANGFGGDKAPEAAYWTATLPITAWREGDGPITREDTCLVALADDTLLEYLRRRAPKDSIIQARVRQGLEDHRFLLVGLPTPMMDPELKAILDEQVKEVSHWVEGLGTFVLNRSLNWFQADVDWLEQSAQLLYDNGTQEEQRSAQETALALLADSEGWDEKVRTFAAQQLPLQCAGQEEELLSLPPEELRLRLEVESIQTGPDGAFSFWFHDRDYQWDGVVRVRGTLAEGPTGAELEV